MCVSFYQCVQYMHIYCLQDKRLEKVIARMVSWNKTHDAIEHTHDRKNMGMAEWDWSRIEKYITVG